MGFVCGRPIFVVLVLKIEQDVRLSGESSGCSFDRRLIALSAEALSALWILHHVDREAQIDDEAFRRGAIDEQLQLCKLERTQRAVAVHQRFGTELPVREDANAPDALGREVFEIGIEHRRRRKIVRYPPNRIEVGNEYEKTSPAVDRESIAVNAERLRVRRPGR